MIDLCGVYLDESKAYLIEARLGELVKSAGCESYAEFRPPARLRRRSHHPQQDHRRDHDE